MKQTNNANIDLIFKHLRKINQFLASNNLDCALYEVCFISSLIDEISKQQIEIKINKIVAYLSKKDLLVQAIMNKFCINESFCIIDFNKIDNTNINFLNTNNYENIKIIVINLPNDINSLGRIDRFAYENSQSNLILAGDYYSLVEIEILKYASLQACSGILENYNFYYYKLVKQYDILPQSDAYAVTLVTSMYNGEIYIKSFLYNLISSSLFGKVRLLIFDVGKNNNDLLELIPFLKKYKNIEYFKLKSDPGLYNIWNLGIYMSNTLYVGNANLDDRRHPMALEMIVDLLNQNEEIMLASTHVVPIDDFEKEYCEYNEENVNIFFKHISGYYYINDMFLLQDNKIISHCIPHCLPIWRKSVHEELGYFNEGLYYSAADFEFWLRLFNNKLLFYCLPFQLSYYYVNQASYMRIDTNHISIIDKLYDIYISHANQESDFYVPDFEKLMESMLYTINYQNKD